MLKRNFKIVLETAQSRKIWSLCIFKSLLSLISFDLKQWLSLAVVVNFDAWYLTFSHFWDDDFVFHAGWRGKMNDAFHCRCEKGGEEVWTLTILWLLRTLKSYGEDSWLLVCGGDKRGNFFLKRNLILCVWASDKDQAYFTDPTNWKSFKNCPCHPRRRWATQLEFWQATAEGTVIA